ncbi:MAG: 6-hydroxymethylpterin diphosphokinase MptE-like protein, partial [Pseudomonadota bacterium]
YLGNKLNHFAFNHFYTEIGAVLASQEQARSVLPDTLALLIIFGLGNAYTLNTISAQKDLKHLFIVEPNPDFFYWSLLVADWSTIFSNIIDKEGQMYLNIGQLNEGLSGELTRQYAFIGNHHVAKTWIYQGYNTPSLNLYLNKVRGTFKTLFSISDNFNHCFYSLEHFLYSVENAFGYMTKTVNAESKKYGHVPVFMVGNGPSVDSCIEQLREYQDQAIIVSCGTTLKTLYNCGIVPDYHAEVESYRANYDWITQIPDPEYLSKITLISPDGIHPDNTKLFKNTLFALKNGESATVIHRYLFPDHDFVVLSEAYPTVSNFCLTFFIHAGFQEIYLLGVDLGYIDPDRHHGQNSSYYENNKTLYTVAKDENSVLSVVGNFLPTVLTKHEFNLARSVMEQALAKANIDCYNTSNGAKIAGAIPLLPQDIMVLTSEADKQQALCRFEGAFTPLSDEFMHRYEAVFQPSKLSDRIFSMAEQLPDAFDCVTEIDTLVKSHERVLREDKSNLLVLALLPSTIQCFFAALIKTSLVADAEIALQNANHILSAYRELLFKSAHLTKNTSDRWDISVAFIERREQRLLQAKPLTLAIEDKHAGESLNDIIRPDHIVIEGWKDESFSSDIFVINDMHRLDTLRAAVDQQVELDGLILTFDIAIADAAQKICVTTPKLAALYYDLSDYLSLAQQGQKEHAQDINLPLIEFIETSLQARFSQRIDFSAMYYKPRFDMQPHIRKLSTDPSHPANWQQVVDMLEAINQHDIKVIFKHFIAIPRPCDEKASGRDDAKLDGTILDTFENRGMQVERRIYPMEVLDYCYISSNHHQ